MKQLPAIPKEREQEIDALGVHLKALIDAMANSPDPVVGAGLCVMHQQTGISCVSFEVQGPHPSTLLGMAITLVGGLVEKQPNQEIEAKLRSAMELMHEAMVHGHLPAPGEKLN